MNLRMAMCEALVDGWHGDWKMGRVVAHAWRLTGAVPENETASYLEAAEAVNVRHLHGAERAQTWIARNMRDFNETLWAGRRREMCIACAQKTLGIGKPKALPLPVTVPERDSWQDCDAMR